MNNLIQSATDLYDRQTGHVTDSACIALRDFLRAKLDPAFLSCSDLNWYRFRNFAAPFWHWAMPVFCSGQTRLPKQFLDSKYQFYLAFDGLRTEPVDKDFEFGFIHSSRIDFISDGYFSNGCFPDFQDGKLIYSEAGGGFICELPEGSYWWIVLGDDEPQPVASSFHELITKFTFRLEKSGKGLLPYE